MRLQNNVAPGDFFAIVKTPYQFSQNVQVFINNINIAPKQRISHIYVSMAFDNLHGPWKGFFSNTIVGFGESFDFKVQNIPFKQVVSYQKQLLGFKESLWFSIEYTEP